MTLSTPDNTRMRLLMQAERLFAQKGYAAVSVREITAAAETNLAAVNYHFGNKMNLYLSVFRECWLPRANSIRQVFKNSVNKKTFTGVPDIIRAVAAAFLEGAVSEEERRCHISLMQRELAHPTKAIDIVVSEVIRPTHRDIGDLIAPFLPDDYDPEQLSLSIFSMISMILYFGFAQPVISRVMDRKFDPAFKDRIIDHIVSFSMDGIHRLIKEKTD